MTSPNLIEVNHTLQKVLIIQLTRLGDSVQTLPLLKRFKQLKPDCSVTVLAVKECSAFFHASPFVDRLVPLAASDILELQRHGRLALEAHSALAESYDAVINLTHNMIGGLFARQVRATNKFGLVGNEHPEGLVLGDWAKYVFASQRSRRQNLFNIVDMQIGMSGLSPAPVNNYLRVTEDALENARQLLKAHGHTGRGCLIGLQLGASQRHKTWPVANYAALARELLGLPGVEVVLLGSNSEKDLSAHLRTQVEARAIDLVGKTEIMDLPGILKCCNLLVSNDTGTIHIAAAVGAKTLGLFFSTVYMGETAPYGADHIVLQAELPCAPCHADQRCQTLACRNAIPVALVQQVVESLLFDGSLPHWNFSDVCAYQSRFLANGTLAYAPISIALITDAYLTGLIHQAMWAPLLGLEPDWQFLSECWSRTANPGYLRETMTAVRHQIIQWRNLYSKATYLAHDAFSILANPAVDQAELIAINGEMQKIEASIASFDNSILKYYHMLTMTELDYGDYPHLVSQLTKSYSKLSLFTGTFLHTLARLSQSVDEAFCAGRDFPPAANHT